VVFNFLDNGNSLNPIINGYMEIEDLKAVFFKNIA
jgi:hypothetical protein